jgi:hypothetical protein
MNQLNNVLDQAVLNSGVTNAGTTLTGASIGEAAGNIVMTAANTANIFTAMGRVLDTKKRLDGERFALIGPRMKETIVNYVGGRETGFGDTVGDNGVVGKRFGFRLVLSNNLPFSATLDGATIFVAGETITINGVTFTARADGAATGAGGFSIQTSAALCIAQLASAINDDGTPGVDTYIALSAEDRQLLEESGIAATISGTNLLLTGYGDIVVSESCAGNGWSAQKQSSLSGITGAVALITQVAPNVVFRDAQLRLGKYVHPWTLYGVGVFERMKNNLVACSFDASSWV